ncbi:MAG: HAMP domain-containing histidine kinase [Desulfovibrionaceae bacterium]|nr:HAMP domain-containing histidine kinase [Desulfovibrionaceae bacterium]
MSVKSKLLLLFAVLFTAFAFIFIVNTKGSEVMTRMRALEEFSADAFIDVLHMRRHEKNFIIRSKLEYVDKVENYYLMAKSRIKAISSISDLPECDHALSLLDNYWESFSNLVDSEIHLGLSVDQGLLADFNLAAGRLEAVFEAAADRDMFVRLLIMRRTEKNFLLRGGEEFVDQVAASLTELRAEISASKLAPAQKIDCLAALNDYEEAFRSVVNIQRLRRTLNVRFVHAAREIEPIIIHIRQYSLQERARISSLVNRLILGIELATVLAVSLFVIWIIYSITRPLAGIRAYSHQVASGDLEAGPDVRLKAEFGALYQDINQMVGRLKEKIVQLQEAEQEAVREADRANAAMRRAEEASRMKSVFLSTVSHELRTPLTSVLGFAKIISKRLRKVVFPHLSEVDEECRQAVSQIEGNLDIALAEGMRLTRLVDGVIDLTCLQAGEVDWEVSEQDPAAMLDEAAVAGRDLAREKGLAFSAQSQPDMPRTPASRRWLVKALANLMDNAVKFTDQGSVDCRAEVVGREVVFSVRDSGKGIPVEEQGKVFEMLRQLGDHLTGKPPGLGLGLAVCKEVALRHGGRVWVTSEPGKGSAFYLSIPATPGRAGEKTS